MTRGTRTPAMVILVAVLIAVPGARVIRAENVDPANDGSQFAWGENVGWLNAEPMGDGGAGIQVDDFAVTGWIWGENIGWVSLSCANTGTCGTADWGVTSDGHGRLGGFAWGENIGWVNFAPSSSTASIDPATGEFSGYAWSENAGWISLSCSNTAHCGVVDYGIRTDWCQSTTPVTGTADIRAARLGDDLELSQLAPGGGSSWHEIVRGNIAMLIGTGGDYGVATGGCVGDNVTTSTVFVSGSPEPVPDDGYWYLARRVNCRGKGTHDSGAPSQVGARDAEIAGSGNDCP